MRVLIIESSPACRRQIARLLEARGHVALTEDTLAGGIRLARSQRPDLILIRAGGSDDGVAPESAAAAAAESCIAAVAQLKTHPRTAPIMVLALIDAGPPVCPATRRFLRRRTARAAAATAADAAGIRASARAAINVSDRMLAAGCEGRVVFPSEPGVFLAKVERFLRRVPPPRHPDELIPISLAPPPLPPLPDAADPILPEQEERTAPLLPGDECLLMGAAPATDAGDDLLLPLGR